MNELNVDHLLRIVEVPFKQLMDRYGYDVASEGASLAQLLRVACIAELKKVHDVCISMNVAKRSIIIVDSANEGYADVEILDEIIVHTEGLRFKDVSGEEYKRETSSLFILCTARNCISFGSENISLLEKYSSAEDLFTEEGQLKRWPRKKARQVQVLDYISALFESGKKYSEGHVDQEVRFFHDDYALVRRELVSRGYLNRMKDGSLYWLADDACKN